MKKFLIVFLALSLLLGNSAYAKEIVIENGSEPGLSLYALASLDVDPELYDCILNGIRSCDSSIDIERYNVDTNDIYNIYTKIVHEHPELYYVTHKLNWKKYSNGIVTDILPVYFETDKTVIDENMSKIEFETNKVLSLLNDNMSELEKVLIVHDYLVLHYQYDTSYTINDISILYTKTGVCESYAKAMYYILNKAGVECSYAQSQNANHIWNIVKIDGSYYHIDATHDDPINDRAGLVGHEFAVISTQKLINLSPEKADMDNDYPCTSTIYDDAFWHNSVSGMSYLDGKLYLINDRNIYDINGNVYKENITGIDGWMITDTAYFPGESFGGTVSYNGLLYYCSDTEIRSFNPKTNKENVVKSNDFFAGIYEEEGKLYYSKYNTDNYYFEPNGTIDLPKVRVGEVYKDKNVYTVKGFVSEGGSLDIYGKDSTGFYKRSHNERGSFSETFSSNQLELFFWNNNLSPYILK